MCSTLLDSGEGETFIAAGPAVCTPTEAVSAQQRRERSEQKRESGSERERERGVERERERERAQMNRHQWAS